MITSTISLGGILTLLTEVVALAAGLVGFLKLKGHVEGVHILVNSRLTSVLNRVDQLVKTLKEHSISVPDDPDPDPATREVIK